jgi:hypothetical protein
MPDTFNIPENAIEPVARAICNAASEATGRRPGPSCDVCKERASDAIQACLKEWGAAEVRRGRMFPSEKRKGILEHRATERRLVFPWEPVEGDVPAEVLDHDTEENT